MQGDQQRPPCYLALEYWYAPGPDATLRCKIVERRDSILGRLAHHEHLAATG